MGLTISTANLFVIILSDLEHWAQAEGSRAGVYSVHVFDDAEAGDDQGESELEDAQVHHHGPQGDPAHGGEPGPLPAHSHCPSSNLILRYPRQNPLCRYSFVCSYDCSAAHCSSVLQRQSFKH